MLLSPTLRTPLFLAWALALGALPLAARPPEQPTAAQLIPPDAVIVVELRHPDDLLDPLLDERLAASIATLPAYDQVAADPGIQTFLGVIQFLEAQLATDWRTGLRTLIGGGATFAADAHGGTLLCVDSEDALMLGRLQQTLLFLAKNEAAKKGEGDGLSSFQIGDVLAWSAGPEEAHAVVGSRLLMTNSRERLEAVLARQSRPASESSAPSASFAAARRVAGDGAAVRVFVDLKALRDRGALQDPLGDDSNPLGALLFAGVLDAAQTADWVALGLHVDGGKVRLTATTDHKPLDPTGPGSFTLPRGPDAGAPENLAIPRRIVGLSFYRDLHRFYAAKDDLFPERTSGLIFFENMMGIFFSGLDLTDEVLGETQPEIRFVVAEQVWDPAVGTPTVQFPSFALVLRLRHPDKFGEIVEEAWQKAIGLTNFTRGQQALPGLIIDRRDHDGTRFSIAYFRPPQNPGSGPAPSRYNTRPSLAQLGEHLILGSTEALTRDLIDALGASPGKTSPALAGAHSLIELDGAQLRSILLANRDNLLLQNMLEKGNSEEEAAAGIDLMLTLLQCLGPVSLRVGSPGSAADAELRMQFLPLPDAPVSARLEAPGESGSTSHES